ncbi:MAG: hypothetical protein U1E17_07955 [Geminicoccaceae bacterium]
MGKKGRKFIGFLAKENRQRYDEFVQATPVWREFHKWIKSRDFVYGALDMLKAHDLDLGYRHVEPGKRPRQGQERGPAQSGCRPTCRSRRASSSRPCRPMAATCCRTPTRPKVCTMIVSILEDSEWDQAFGGGTDVNWPRTRPRASTR